MYNNDNPYSALYEFDNFTFQGEAKIFLGVPRQDWGIPPVQFSFKGNDPRNVLKRTQPRPAQGGIYLGSASDCVENVEETLEEVPQANSSIVPLDYRTIKEVVSVEATSNYSADPYTARFFRPNGADGGYYFTWGGKAEKDKTSCLLVRENKIPKVTRFFEAHYIPWGVSMASKVISSDKKVTLLNFKFLPVAARGPDNCPLPFGQQTLVGWYFRILPDGTNELVHPLFPMDKNWYQPDYLPFFNKRMDMRLGF